MYILLLKIICFGKFATTLRIRHDQVTFVRKHRISVSNLFSIFICWIHMLVHGILWLTELRIKQEIIVFVYWWSWWLRCHLRNKLLSMLDRCLFKLQGCLSFLVTLDTLHAFSSAFNIVHWHVIVIYVDSFWLVFLLQLIKQTFTLFHHLTQRIVLLLLLLPSLGVSTRWLLAVV